MIEPCKYCGEIEHSKLSALTHVCDKDVLRERITDQRAMLTRIYENARGYDDSVHAVTRWEVDTVDYQALGDFLFPNSEETND